MPIDLGHPYFILDNKVISRLFLRRQDDFRKFPQDTSAEPELPLDPFLPDLLPRHLECTIVPNPDWTALIHLPCYIVLLIFNF